MLLVTNHARPVPTTHSNVLHVLTISSAQTEDVPQVVLLDNISMLSQEPADNAHPLAPLAALNRTVLPVQTTRFFQSVDNACHAFTHALLAQPI